MSTLIWRRSAGHCLCAVTCWPPVLHGVPGKSKWHYWPRPRHRPSIILFTPTAWGLSTLSVQTALCQCNMITRSGCFSDCHATAAFADAIKRKRCASLKKRMRVSSKSLLSVFVAYWNSLLTCCVFICLLLYVGTTNSFIRFFLNTLIWNNTETNLLLIYRSLFSITSLTPKLYLHLILLSWNDEWKRREKAGI